MDCYYHSAVPSVARCTGCGQAVCATCRGATGDCPSCRLAQKLDAARGPHPELTGTRRAASPPPPPPPRWSAPERPRTAVAAVKPETRALVALGYPFWPLALLALLDRTPVVRRHALQALGFNAGIYGLAWLLTAIAAIPLIGWPAWPLLPFVIPVALVASVVYGFRTWQGEDVRVPFVSDWLDERDDPSGSRTSRA